MTESDLAEMRSLLKTIRKASDFYQKATSFDQGTRILKACEGTITKLHEKFGVNEFWLESLVIFGGEFYKAEKSRMMDEYPKKTITKEKQLNLNDQNNS